jgi:phosphatidate phosphatase PAH1
VVTANIFVWPEDVKVVVADIEGAIFVSGGSSSSGPLGLMMSLWGSSSARRETHVGLAQVFVCTSHAPHFD